MKWPRPAAAAERQVVWHCAQGVLTFVHVYVELIRSDSANGEASKLDRVRVGCEKTREHTYCANHAARLAKVSHLGRPRPTPSKSRDDAAVYQHANPQNRRHPTLSMPEPAPDDAAKVHAIGVRVPRDLITIHVLTEVQVAAVATAGRAALASAAAGRPSSSSRFASDRFLLSP